MEFSVVCALVLLISHPENWDGSISKSPSNTGLNLEIGTQMCGLLVQKAHPNPQPVASSEPLINAPKNGQEAAMTQPRGEFLPDGSNWLGLGMILLSDEGSCVGLQMPAGLWDGEKREFYPCCAMEAAVTNHVGQKQPCIVSSCGEAECHGGAAFV